MKTFPKCSLKSVAKIIEHANKNICTDSIKKSDRSTFIFQEEKVICTFNLLDKSGCKNRLLNSCYYLSLTFYEITADGKIYIQPFDHKRAAKIVKAFFSKTNLVWEHAPFTKEGAASCTHHFYLFVSIPYGRKPVILQADDMKELIENKYILYEGGK